MDPPKQVFTTPAAVKAVKERVLKDRSQEKGKKGGKPKGGKDRNESVDLTEDEEETETAEEKRERETMEREMLAKQGSTKLFKTPPGGSAIKHKSAKDTSAVESQTPTTPAGEGERHGEKRMLTPEEEAAKRARKEGRMESDAESEMSAGEASVTDWRNDAIEQTASALSKECFGLCNMILKLAARYGATEREQRRLVKSMTAVKREADIVEIDLAEAKDALETARAKEAGEDDLGPQILAAWSVDNAGGVEKIEMSTQTPASWNTPGGGEDKEDRRKARAMEIELIDQALEKGGLDDLIKVKDLAWPATAYKNVKESQADIWSLDWGWDLVLPVTRGLPMSDKVGEAFGDRFKATGRLQTRDYGVGQVAHLTETVAISGEGVEDPDELLSRRVYYPVMAAGEGDPWSNDDVAGAITKLKTMVALQPGRKVAVVCPEGKDIRFLKKSLQWAFNDMQTAVALVRPRVPKGQARTRPPIKVNTGEGTQLQKKRPPPPKEEAVIVRRKEGVSYADLLREVKGKVNITETGVGIAGVRETRGGDLLISLKKSEPRGQAAKLATAIKDKVRDVRVDSLTEKTATVHVSGIEVTSTKEEVEEAIRTAMGWHGDDGKSVKVSGMWPAFGNNQNAAVELPKPKADALIQIGAVPIGWARCRVRERVSVSKCFKCWASGHMIVDCKGEDRRLLCHRCGEKGHLAKMCTATPYCPLCKESGHRASSTRCPIFRRELEEKTSRRRRGEDPDSLNSNV